MGRCKLTTEMATKLEYYWQISSEATLSDADICARIGLPYGRLRTWLETNARVVRENGQVESISVIRARARVMTLTSYLQRHHALLIKAENAGDLKVAHTILCWLEMKQFPAKYNRPPEPADDATHQYGVIEVPATVPDAETWSKGVQKHQS